MPAPITFVDVETTGLSREDRVVSLGIVHLADSDHLTGSTIRPEVDYLVFNPQRPSHPAARKVHGYADADLARQDVFAVHQPVLRRYFDHGGTVVAHNASFDRRFLSFEFSACDKKHRHPEYHCTMLSHRRTYGSKSGLDAVLEQMGSPRRQQRHGALQDAWHALEVYCWLNRLPAPRIDALPVRPKNWREAGSAGPASASVPAELSAKNEQQPETSLAYRQALTNMRPIADVLMSIARADDQFSHFEVDTMTLFINARMETMRFALTGDEYVDLLAELCSNDPSANDVRKACLAITRNSLDRDELAWWVGQMTFADGSSSKVEQEAIRAVMDAVSAAKRLL